MKHIQLYLICTALLIPHASNAAPHHFYSNNISANNIAAFQHSISHTTIHSFGIENKSTNTNTPTTQYKNADKSLYGTMPLYGEMLTYGEYGDDGSVFSSGRAGGDTPNAPSIDNFWINWAHFGDDVKFEKLNTLNSDYDLVTIGFDFGKKQVKHHEYKIGLFSGYVNANQTNDHIELEENGGYIGAYIEYQYNNLNISGIIDGGVIFTNSEIISGDDEFANPWVGGTIKTSYNLKLDDSFSLRPTLYIGYTWIKSANYTSTENHTIENQNFNMFEVTPALRAIKHIANQWYGTLDVQYITNISGGGNTTIDDKKISKLDTTNYTEFSLGLEKSIDNFCLSAHLGRREGERSGWIGGFNLKYTF